MDHAIRDWRHRGETIGVDQSGFTLIEILVTIVIVGTGFVVLLGGMTILVTSSSLHRTQAIAEAELRKYSELVEGSYSPTGDYSKAQSTMQGDPNMVISPSLSLQARPPNVVACYPSGVTGSTPPSCSGGEQQVVLSLFSSDGRVDEKISVLMRSP